MVTPTAEADVGLDNITGLMESHYISPVLSQENAQPRKLGLQAPDFIEFDSAPTTLCSELYTDFQKQISSGMRSDCTTGSLETTQTDHTNTSMGMSSSQTDESGLSPYKVQGGYSRTSTTQHESLMRVSASLLLSPSAPPGLSKQQQQQSPGKVMVDKGHTKVLVQCLATRFTRQGFVDELKDASFRPLHDFVSLNFPIDPMTGLNQGYCTITFVNISTARAFTSSFDGRHLRSSSNPISVRPFKYLESSDDELEDDLNSGTGGGFIRAISV